MDRTIYVVELLNDHQERYPFTMTFHHAPYHAKKEKSELERFQRIHGGRSEYRVAPYKRSIKGYE